MDSTTTTNTNTNNNNSNNSSGIRLQGSPNPRGSDTGSSSSGSNVSIHSDGMLNARVTEVERRLAMFENMFHALSGKLDQHFKRYDVIIQSQQQRITDLNSLVTTLLNDRVQQAESMRDKLLNEVTGTSTQPNLITDVRDQSFPVQQDMIRHDNNSNLNNNNSNNNTAMFNARGADELLEDILNRDTNTTTANNNNVVNGLGPRSRTLNLNNNTTTTTTTTITSTSRQSDVSRSVLDRNKAKDIYYQNQDPMMKTTVQMQYPSAAVLPEYPPNNNNNNTNNINPSPRLSPHNIRNIRMRHTQSIKTHRSASSPDKPMIHEYKFIKSPHSVREIWLEYVEGFRGQLSIKEMEARYQSSWRREPAVTKRFSRRKVLCKAIENGIAKGYDLDNVINLLENHRVMDHGKGIKQPIGWLCQPANIPQVFK